MADATRSGYRDILRSDLYAFIERSFRELNPQTPFFGNWHLEVLAAKLEAVRRGEILRLIVNVPPRSLKSHCVSVAFVAWLLGHNPSAQILTVSYAQDLSDKLARDCRSLMSSSFFKSLFRTRLSGQKQAVAEFETIEKGFRLSSSVGGVLTGRGADYIIIDDPLKPDEALSETRRQAVNDWYDNTLFSRLNDKKKGAIIVIMQRLHEDGLVGHVLGQEDWEVLSFPAIAEKDEEYRIETPYGPHGFMRRAGEALQPEREPLETLTRIRRTLGEANFSAQYQQAPTPPGGLIIKAAWFRRYASGDLPHKFDQIVQSWDTANKATELSDYSVCTTWGVKDRRCYLLDVFRRRLEYPELKRMVRELARQYQATLVLIEDKASGTQLIQELKNDGFWAVKACDPDRDKVMRLYAQCAIIENGNVLLPQAAAWLPGYLHELTTFPNAKHDDQADSTAQALSWLNMLPPEPGLLTYYRREVEKQKGTKSSKMVRIKGADGCSTVITRSGQQICADAEGVFDLTEEDAAPFLRRPGWKLVPD